MGEIEDFLEDEEGSGLVEVDQALEVNDSAVDAEAVNKSRKKANLRRKLSERFWRQVLSDPIGRAEVWGLLKEAGTFERPFACGPNGFPQPEATWFMAGRKEFGQNLYHKLLVHDRDGVNRMLDEHYPAFAKPKRRVVTRGIDDQQ